MTSTRRLRGVLTVAFVLVAVLAGGMGIVFVQDARRHIGADYTGLATEIVRAQLSTLRLQRAAAELGADPGSARRRQLRQAVWLLEHRRRTVAHVLGESALTGGDVGELQATLVELEAPLARLESLAGRAPGDTPGWQDQVEALSAELESRLSFAFSELLEAVLSASATQRRLMGWLAFALLGLVGVLLALVAGLLIVVGKLHGQRQTLTRLTVTDPLTGLYNRRAMIERSQPLLAQARRQHRPIALAVLDLDGFKRLNDRHGHPCGDQVLQALGGVLSRTVREADIVARLGGEEFAVLMPDTGVDDGVALCERLRHTIEGMHRDPGADLPAVTASMGLAGALGADAGFEELYARADRALYTAKRAGRNQVRVSPPAPVAVGDHIDEAGEPP